MPITTIVFIADGANSASGNGHEQEFARALLDMRATLNGLGGFLCASVQWRPMGKFLVNRSSSPLLLGENPPASTAKGWPELAGSVEKAAEASGLWAEATEEWGLDPGHWLPLSFLQGEAELPVLPLSMSQMSPEAHRKWGVTIRRGAQKYPESLALVISGSLSAREDLQDDSDPNLDKARQFDDEIVRILSRGKLAELEEMDKSLFRAAKPQGGWGPLYCLWGALGENAQGSIHHYSHPFPGVGSTAISFHVK